MRESQMRQGIKNKQEAVAEGCIQVCVWRGVFELSGLLQTVLLLGF